MSSTARSHALGSPLAAARTHLGLIALLLALAAVGWWSTADRMSGMDAAPGTGYLLTWTAAGLLAYATFELSRAVLGDQLAWDGAGRWVAGGVLVVAAAYELTPLKETCLAKCRSPIGWLVGSWRDGLAGAVGMGARHGASCVGCCWALMAALFALGVMSRPAPARARRPAHRRP
jgi:predicted metal-binding membrane protein